MHDIDKGGSKRSKPKPNSSDSVVDRLAHGTTQLQHSIDEAESDGLLIRERQILAVQDGFEKAVMGFYGTENKFGLKVAEDGVNVTEATDDQLIFNSEQNVFKIVDSGTISLFYPASSGQVTTVVNHNLGYIPAALIYYYSDPYYFPTQFTVFNSSGVAIANIDWYIDATNLTLRFTKYNVAGSTYASDSTIIFKYFLMQETAS